MALRKVLTDADPLLRKRSREITEITGRIRILADDMWETMAEANGIGLAAPQVGVLRRMVVIEVPVPAEDDADPEGESETEGDDIPIPEPETVKYVLINPEIIEVSEETVIYKEGCLSIPGMIGDVERPKRVKIRAVDLEGNSFELTGEGLLARALQHEIDHLEGILYSDLAESIVPIEAPGEEGEAQEGE